MYGNRILEAHNLFILEHEKEGKVLLYAPLADSCLYVNDEQIDGLVKACTDYEASDEEYRVAFNALTDVIPVSERDCHIRNARDFLNLSILPNNKCNFSCGYCYSARGRSSRQISWSQVKGMMEWFFSKERRPADGQKLHVTFYGGGEPLLSWKEVIRPAFDWLFDLMQNPVAPQFYITLITNGSLLPDGFMEYCRKLSIDLVCSYEILEDVQNSQRRHFGLVTSNIHIMMQNGVIPAFNSVVTPLNVERQEEMVYKVVSHFKDVRYLSFEPVIDVVLKEDHRNFYDKFILNFQKARAVASVHGISLTCSALRNVDVTVDRYCAGELALVANGALSVCPCVSSPEEEDFSEYIYGNVSCEGEVDINLPRLHELLSHDLYRQPWCKNCFAKWNCGGGCTRLAEKRGMTQDLDFCYFMRFFILQELINRMNETE